MGVIPRQGNQITNDAARRGCRDVRNFTVELLRIADKWSTLLRGTNHDTMLITVNIPTFHDEAAPAASVLAGRCAR